MIRELLATEITNDVCKELLYHNIDPIFFDCADDFRITDITHKIIDDYNMNTIVETSWDQNGKTKSLKFNLDEFLITITMKTYRPYMVIDFAEDKMFLITTEDEIINRILKYPIFLNKDIDKLNYIIQNILEP